MKKALFLFLFIGLISGNFFTAQAQIEDFSIGQKFGLKSKFTDYNYNIAVYLPRDYEANKNKQDYPTLYLFLGGDNMFHSVSGMVHLMSDQGQIPQMIVVGITNISWWHDLTPEKLEWKPEAGGGKDFLNFVSQQLISIIDKNYATSSHRIFMGHSLGGMFGIYTLTEEKDLFNDFVLISPSIADRANSLFGKLEKTVKTSKSFEHDIYMTMGNEGDRIARGMHKVSAALTLFDGPNLNWKMKEMDGHNHFTLMIPTMFDGLRYVCKNEMKDE